MRKLPRYTCNCGDATYHFKYGWQYREREVKEIFRRIVWPLQQEILPGLELVDWDGNVLVPRLQIVLIPKQEGT